jgi:hypothetical protein
MGFSISVEATFSHFLSSDAGEHRGKKHTLEARKDLKCQRCNILCSFHACVAFVNHVTWSAQSGAGRKFAIRGIELSTGITDMLEIRRDIYLDDIIDDNEIEMPP